MAMKKAITAGKRTARPGARGDGAEVRAAVRRNTALPARAGKRKAALGAQHVVAHQRAVAQRAHNPRSKSH